MTTPAGATAGIRVVIRGEGLEAIAAAKREVLLASQASQTKVVLDVGGVVQAGAAFLEALLAAESWLAMRGKTVRLSGVSPELRTAFDIAGLKGWFLEERAENG